MPTNTISVIDSRLIIDSIKPMIAPTTGKYNFTLNLGGYFGANIDKLYCIVRNRETNEVETTGRTIWINPSTIFCKFDMDLEYNGKYYVALSSNGL